MSYARIVAWTGAACMALLLSACGGGGSGGDISPSEPPVSTKSGLDNFLIFPNPQISPDGSPAINSVDYAQAYYAAIDPGNAKDTLAKWKAANGFDSGTGTQVTVVFGDKRDLGYGRRMTARKSADGTIAFLVENYLANPGGAYGFSPLSLEAAVLEDHRWLLHVNAIEFSPGPGGRVAFAKFFNFDPATGERRLSVDIDGRGQKFMPGVCIACHGGRGDGMTAPDPSGKRQILVVENSKSAVEGDRQPGDVQAHLAPFEVSTFEYSSRAGFTRADQEANLKAMNQLVLCTYPLPVGTTGHSPEDDCRRQSIITEWQGTGAALIKGSYGGDGLPSAGYFDIPVPQEWAAQADLYQNVVAPSCRACHILRGTGVQSDIDFGTLDEFASYAIFPGNTYPKTPKFDDRIKVHVFDRGNMPLAKIVYDAFWGSSNPEILGRFLEQQGFTVRDAAGKLLQPGRPTANPGPDRAIRIADGPVTLSADKSLPADTFSWTVVSGPDGAAPPSGITLTNPTSANPTVTATTPGVYVLQLVVSTAAGGQSVPALLTLGVIDTPSTGPPLTSPRFADIKHVLQVTGGCVTCHDASVNGSTRPPVFFSDSGNDAQLYAEVRSRINFTDIVASPLLRKPAGRHHAGSGPLSGFDDTKKPGDALRASYDTFVNWIASGAPQ